LDCFNAMGSCFAKPPVQIKSDVEADGNACCDELECPSNCCFLVLVSDKPDGTMTPEMLIAGRIETATAPPLLPAQTEP
jgi:hypothetical protein